MWKGREREWDRLDSSLSQELFPEGKTSEQRRKTVDAGVETLVFYHQCSRDASFLDAELASAELALQFSVAEGSARTVAEQQLLGSLT